MPRERAGAAEELPTQSLTAARAGSADGESIGADVPACVDCGCCCFSKAAEFVKVTGYDYSRLGDRGHALVVWRGNRAFMRLTDGHCAALVIDARSGQFRCKVYDKRPEVCRALARGSGECAGEREVKAERPLVALRLARDALAPSSD